MFLISRAAGRRPEKRQDMPLNLKNASLIMVLFAVCAGLSGCSMSDQPPYRSESRGVEAQNADAVKAKIKMRTGNLHVTGGAAKLMEGDFLYQEKLKPEINYTMTGRNGILNLSQSGPATLYMKSARSGSDGNRWDLKFNDRIPMELIIEMDTGSGNVRLGNLSLTKLDMMMGTGNITADFVGNWKNDLRATVHGGLGNTTIRLPSDVGVKLTAVSALGSLTINGLSRQGDAYINKVYGKSHTTLFLEVSAGVGHIDVETE
jgi:N-terminal domain of toast_rack, DUF2154